MHFLHQVLSSWNIATHIALFTQTSGVIYPMYTMIPLLFIILDEINETCRIQRGKSLIHK